MFATIPLRPFFFGLALVAIACAPDSQGEAGKNENSPGESSKTSETGETSKSATTRKAGPHAGLKDPSLATEKAPDKFRVRFKTTKGDVDIEVVRDWAPKGADRFYNLVKVGFFKDIAFFRVIEGFMAQFGIHGDPEIAGAWQGAMIGDDPVKQSNQPGYLTFAKAGPDTRTTQFFINLGPNGRLDGQGFPPIGKVVSGMDIMLKIYAGYGDAAPKGRGPDQGEVKGQGNKYLKSDFPDLDYILSATFIK